MKSTMLFELVTNDGEVGKPHRIAGWSESYYQNELTNFASNIQFFESLCQRRAALLPTGASIVGQRYQIVDPVGTSQTGDRLFPGGSNLAADYPGLAMFMRIPASGARNIGHVALRGIPDARCVLGEYSNFSETYNSAIVAFLSLLNSAIWRFKGRDLSQIAYPMIGIAANGTFTTEGNHTLNAGDMVRVLRTNDEDGNQVGGRFKIIAPVTATSGVLLNYDLGETTKGAIRKDLTVYPQYGTLAQVRPRIVARKVGRPFTGFRGRASKKK